MTNNEGLCGQLSIHRDLDAAPAFPISQLINSAEGAVASKAPNVALSQPRGLRLGSSAELRPRCENTGWRVVVPLIASLGLFGTAVETYTFFLLLC